MENKARYTVVGLFLIIFASAMIAFVIWLARYDIDKINAKEFRLYSKNSISGLTENSIVIYKGLDIGTIEKIRINSQDLEEIEIILKITNPNIIKENSYAIIQSQGVTGNKIVEIDGGTQQAKPLFKDNKKFAIIPLKKSFIEKLTTNADSIGIKLESVLKSFEKMLNDKNLKNIENILNNTNKASKNFDTTITKINTLVDSSLSNTLEKIEKLTENIDHMVENDVENTLNNFNSLSIEAKKVIESDIRLLISDLRDTTNSTQNLDVILNKVENTLEKIDSTVDEFNQNGGNMIFNTRALEYGPGEKNELP
ncbi:hypothetical protein CP965_03020 [Halarcobacter mediterraneus]|uniref:Mce/MlaD domain-containing protein n=1 Tax=Halarcobacter mediterraneus TaxID=2023153 RepID=A0A4V1M1M9_9BACT|nr:MlaD family protein [Halarcobacter mediterraneus]RXK14436.1 hypothetical protein CP965_03020 [Halarcobacter mediterraneus]